jgi:hypothetical protein
MSDSPPLARRRARAYFNAALVFGVLWTASRFVPDDADDWLLVTAGLVRGPGFAAQVLFMLLAFRHRGWADGFEAARSREKADHA